MTLRPIFLACAALCSATAARGADAPPPAESFAHVVGEDGKEVKVPLFDEQSSDTVAARAGDDVVTVHELGRALIASHGNVTAAAQAGKKDPTAILNRIVEVKLLVQEARAMGIADLPEIQQALAAFREAAAQEALKLDVLKDVRPDPADAQRLFEDATREWKLQSVLFPKLEDAKPFSEAVRKGGDFAALSQKAVAEKKAQGGGAPGFVPRAQLLPEVVAALSKLKKGEASLPIRLAQGYTIVRYDEVRYPEDPKAREQARTQSLMAAQRRALRKYYDALVKRRVRTDEKLLRKLDYEAKRPGLAALRKDGRVLSRIPGAGQITIADLTAAIEGELQHGMEQAIKTRRANKLKAGTLDALVSRRLLPMVAREKGYDQTASYKRSVAEYETSFLFAQFVDKAIVPDIKITDADVQRYYDGHKSELTLPGFYKLDGIGFTTVKDAQAALNKLKSGTDLRFLRTTADNQVRDGAELTLTGTTLAASTLPAGLRDQLAQSRKGDYRIYTTERGQSYVVQVLDVTPPQVQPIDQARDAIKQKLLSERVTQAVKEWAAKVRQQRPVKIYVTRVGA